MEGVKKVCAKCNGTYNLYSSKYCRNRIRLWHGEPHYFCIFCCLKKSRNVNLNTDYSDLKRIVCPYCSMALFNVVHIETGTIRTMDELIMEQRLFNLIYRCKHDSFLGRKQRTLDDVMEQIDKVLAIKCS